MISLTLPDGTPCSVNPFHIFAIIPQGEKGSHVIASGGGTIEVRESMLQIEKLVKRWGKDG